MMASDLVFPAWTTSWMRPVQWICMGLFHLTHVGFLLYLSLR